MREKGGGGDGAGGGGGEDEIDDRDDTSGLCTQHTNNAPACVEKTKEFCPQKYFVIITALSSNIQCFEKEKEKGRRRRGRMRGSRMRKRRRMKRRWGSRRRRRVGVGE